MSKNNRRNTQLKTKIRFIPTRRQVKRLNQATTFIKI